MSVLDNQAEFMQAVGQDILGGLGAQKRLYADLVTEEFIEFSDTQAVGYEGKPTDEIKEICDLLVVSAGFLISAIGHEKALLAWDAVFRSNMAKTMNQAEKREDGKVMQNDEYKKVAKAKLLEELDTLLK